MQQGGWVMDSGASFHMTHDDGNLSCCPPHSRPHFVTIGNGDVVPISSSRHALLMSSSGHSFKLNNVLLVPHLIRNFLSIRKFTRDNRCSIEFDAFGFYVKDPKTRREILCLNSDRDLWYVVNVSIIIDAPYLFYTNCFVFCLHFMAFLCIF
jgi:hypothetical protein